MNADELRRINLLEVLADKHPEAAEALPEEAAQSWTEQEITAFYSRYQQMPEPEKAVQYGGFRNQRVDPGAHKAVPDQVMQNRFAGTPAGYVEACIRDGIPFRRAGLFPPNDPFLTELASTSGLHPFEKHLAGHDSLYSLLSKGGWASGNAAAENGLDLRLFYRKDAGEERGRVIGAARLGDKASIGNDFWMGAHGGAIETLLDESTAEIGKLEVSPLLTTIEMSCKLKKAVPLHTTLRIDAKITSVKGFRCWASGTLKLPDTGEVFATCEAQLVDMKALYMAGR